MLLYRVLKYWIRFGYQIFFRKVYFRGKEHVDPDKPAIFAVNHPSAFIEPTLIGTSLPFTVHFMTRGDLFIRSFRWFFKATNQVPVFRFKDGFSRMRSNKSSFAECYSRLEEGAILLIFCEGSMKWVKKLRKVQPGAAKLAFGTLEGKPDLPLVIHPIGVNYDNHTRFRSDAMVEIGPAIDPHTYFKTCHSEPREAIRGLTNKIQEELQKCILHIESDDDLERGDLLWQIVKNEWKAEEGKSASPFSRVKKVLDRFNESKNSPEGEDLRIKLDDYRESLSKAGMTDSDVRGISTSGIGGLSMGLITLVFMPFSIWYYLPLALATLISKKTMSQIEFYVSVRAVVFIFLFSCFMILTAIAFLWLPLAFWWFFVLPLGVWGDLKLKPYRSLLLNHLKALYSRIPISQLAEDRDRILSFINHQISE
jgi:glycerol-3-phosphate O-acyltransferase / dihydroxyacetone phosphate acyltransferase